jgi:hypothetical protein
MSSTGDVRRCAHCRERPVSTAAGLCAGCGGREGRQPDGTYWMVCYKPPTPAPFSRRRDPDREAG